MTATTSVSTPIMTAITFWQKCPLDPKELRPRPFHTCSNSSYGPPSLPVTSRASFAKQLEASRLELQACLSDRRVELADMPTVTHYVKDLRNMLNCSSITEKKSFIKSFIREVSVMGNEVTIRYSLPVQCGLVTTRATTVPPIVHDGGPLWTRTRDPSLIRTVL
jgi:hypothetical protein